MRGSELLDKLELVDPVYITFADTVPRKRGDGKDGFLSPRVWRFSL